MKLLLTAPAGKMGRLVVREALARPEDFTIVGAVGNPARDYIGKDVGIAAGCEPVGALTYGSVEEIISACDGVIDFSTPAVAMEVLSACVRHGKPLLIGTTGFTPEQEAEIERASARIPFSESHNTSKAVNLLYDLLRRAAEALGDEADVDIIEMHDRDKPDAPSGTGKVLGRIVADCRGQDWNGAARFGRGDGRRGPGEITCHSIRSGNIASSHTVILGLAGERLELTHHAYDFSTFARGALDGILFLCGQGPGRYDSRTILGLG